MQLEELTWPKIDKLDRSTPVVIPVAAMEQHGHHLPLSTDTMLLTEIVRRVRAEIGEQLLLTPLMWLGNSDHHIDFPGTLSARPRVYLDMLTGIAETFIQYGFRRIVFLNGHGGNDVPGQQTVFELRQRFRSQRNLLLLFGTYWRLGSDPHKTIANLSQPQMGHAGEWETSMMLTIDDHLVGDYKNAADVSASDPYEPAVRGWTTKDRSNVGHIGSPAKATAEKGEQLLSCFSRDVIAFLTRVINGKEGN